MGGSAFAQQTDGRMHTGPLNYLAAKLPAPLKKVSFVNNCTNNPPLAEDKQRKAPIWSRKNQENEMPTNTTETSEKL